MKYAVIISFLALKICLFGQTSLIEWKYENMTYVFEEANIESPVFYKIFQQDGINITWDKMTYQFLPYGKDEFEYLAEIEGNTLYSVSGTVFTITQYDTNNQVKSVVEDKIIGYREDELTYGFLCKDNNENIYAYVYWKDRSMVSMQMTNGTYLISGDYLLIEE
jgi:hypothetical protein